MPQTVKAKNKKSPNKTAVAGVLRGAKKRSRFVSLKKFWTARRIAAFMRDVDEVYPPLPKAELDRFNKIMDEEVAAFAAKSQRRREAR